MTTGERPEAENHTVQCVAVRETATAQHTITRHAHRARRLDVCACRCEHSIPSTCAAMPRACAAIQRQGAAYDTRCEIGLFSCITLHGLFSRHLRPHIVLHFVRRGDGADAERARARRERGQPELVHAHATWVSGIQTTPLIRRCRHALRHKSPHATHLHATHRRPQCISEPWGAARDARARVRPRLHDSEP